MHSTYDRDDYVTVHLENVKSGQEHNFIKYSNKWVSNYNTTYDYESLMHFGAYAFSTNGQPTIVPVVSKLLLCNIYFNFASLDLF